jgi:uroporphyrinogen III methyltransferase/synthase
MSRPLEDRIVVVTRAVTQNSELSEMLRERGADVLEVPLISIEEPEDEGRERDEVLHNVTDFSWVVVTSPNGADRVAPFLEAAIAADDTAPFPRLAAVGAATERSLGRPADLVAEPARGNVLAESFPAGTGPVLVVQGDQAPDDIPRALRDKGWDVTKVVAYRTVQLRPTDDMASRALAADALLLASGSAATAWCDTFGHDAPPIVISIGPSTTAVAERLGLAVSATSKEQSLLALVDSLENAFRHHWE